MLYERWRRIAAAEPERIGLRDLAAGKSWTFAQMQAIAENGTENGEGIAFPRGTSGEFVFTVLRAWRAHQIVCPLESEQEIPAMLTPLPFGISHLKTTSATTGTPRLVAFKHSQLMADAENIVATMGLRAEWPNLGVVSLAHSYGFSNLVLPLLLHGVPLILAGSALPEALRRAAALEPEVTLAAVPALWSNWHEVGVIPSNVRLAISAGAPLPLSLEQSVFDRCGLKIHNFYGSSECGGIGYDASQSPRGDAACAGTPLHNVEASVTSAGCLEVRGPAVGQAYWPEPSTRLANGVFQTSDLAEIRNGEIYLRGRAGDQINVAGRKVAPEIIEGFLAAHPQVRECVAFGVPSPETQRGETIVACLAVKGDVTEEGLRQFLIAKLPAWQVPRQWWFVNTLRANERGKLSRAEWRQRYLQKATANEI